MINIRFIIGSLISIFSFHPLHSQAQDQPSEKVHVHLSHSIAVAGETIWLKTYSSTDKGPAASKVAYAELINRAGQAVQQVMFELEEGKSLSHIQIPSDIPSDHYLLRCYTRISPFLDQAGIFNQFITVINPKLPPPVTGKIQGQNYNFTKPIIHSSLSTLTKTAPQEAVQIDFRDFGQQELMLSAALRNPFLPETFKGYIDGRIYELPDKQTMIPELYGHVVYAKTKESFGEDKTFFLSAHGKQSVLNSARPNSRGELFFDLGPMKSYAYIILQSADFQQQLDLSIVSPFAQLNFKPDFIFPALELKEEDRPFLQELLVAGKAGAYFSIVNSTEPLPIVTGFVADKTYLLDDFTRFESIEVTLREYVPEVLVRKRDRKTNFKLLNKPLGAVFDENPLLLIDAMPVFDSDQLAGFDPQKIKKLEVLSREFSFNQDKYAGVLSFTTYDNDFGGYELPANALYLNYPSLQPNRKPELNKQNKQTRYPEFKNTLVWETIHPEKGESAMIFTSQTPGIYEIRISKVSEGSFELFSGAFQVEH